VFALPSGTRDQPVVEQASRTGDFGQMLCQGGKPASGKDGVFGLRLRIGDNVFGQTVQAGFILDVKLQDPRVIVFRDG